MKKSFLALASLAAIAVGCQVESMTDVPVVEGTVVYKAVTEAYAPATKTSMTADKEVVWSANDEIAVFQGVGTYDLFKVTNSSVGQTQADFTLVTDRETTSNEVLPCNGAFYPASETIEAYYEDGAFVVYGVNIPATQKYVAGSFGNGAFPMIAVSEDNMFQFKNILGAMKLQLKGERTVKSITVADNAGNPLAGSSRVSYIAGEAPEIQFESSMWEPAPSSVKLDCGEGVALNTSTATDFYIALPETEFEAGFTVTLTDTEGNLLQFEATASNEIKRSRILVMPELDVETLTQKVELKAVSTVSEVTLDITVNDADAFYGIFVNPQTWSIYKEYLVEPSMVTMVLNGQMGVEMPCRRYDNPLTGAKLTEFGLADKYFTPPTDPEELEWWEPQYNYILPNSSYYVIIVPASAEKDATLGMGGGYDDDELGGGVMPLMDLDEEESDAAAGYTLDDFIIYEVSTSDFTSGGSSTLTFDVEEGYLTSHVNITPSDDVKFMFYQVYGVDEVIPTHANYIDRFNEFYEYSGDYEDGVATISVGNDRKMLPGTDWKLAVILADADGLSTLHVIDVALNEIPYSSALKVTVGDHGYDPDFKKIYADVTGCPEGAELYYALVYEFDSTDEYDVAGLQESALNGEYPFTKVSESNIVDGCYTYESAFNQSTRKQERYLIFAVLKDNKIGDLQAVKIEIPAKS